MIELNKYVKGKELEDLMLDVHKGLDMLQKEYVGVNDRGIEEWKITEDSIDMLSAIQQGDESMLDKLVGANLGTIVAVANLYQHKGLSVLELISVGIDELISAARDSKCLEMDGSQFRNHFVSCIKAKYEQILI